MAGAMDLGMEWIDGMPEGREIDGRYVVASAAALGSGSSASVYRGVNKVSGQQIAIKVIDRLGESRDPGRWAGGGSVRQC